MRVVIKPIKLLIISLFFKSFIIQYIAFFIPLLIKFFSKHTTIVKKNFLYIIVYIILISVLSYSYNFFYDNTDGISIIFWIFSYTPPFILILFIISNANKVEFYELYKLYKYIVIFETILLILTSIKLGRYIVSDAGVGTVGDANFIAYHIAIVILYEVSYLLSNKLYGRQKIKKVLEIFYFFIVIIIPEATATFGFLLISIVIIYMCVFIRKINILKIISIFLISLLSFKFISSTMVYSRIDDALNKISNISVNLDSLYLSKFMIYYKLFSGDIYSEVNPLLGSGPATFTSRSSVVRMPDVRFNAPPITVPIFYSSVYKKFVYDNELALKNVSLGNFATPKTSFVSIAVELGILGIVGFFILFMMIIYKLQRNKYKYKHFKPFAFSLTMFYIMHFAFLNSWEYPIYTFTFIIIVFVILYNKKLRRNSVKTNINTNTIN